MGSELIIGTDDSIALAVNNKNDDLLKPLYNEILLFETYLSGTKRLADCSAIDTLRPGDSLILLRKNDFLDDFAILVTDDNRRKVGYIAEKDNMVFARLMDAGKRLTAKVKSIDFGEDFDKVRISIYLIDF